MSLMGALLIRCSSAMAVYYIVPLLYLCYTFSTVYIMVIKGKRTSKYIINRAHAESRTTECRNENVYYSAGRLSLSLAVWHLM
jgi:hypothetical protein